MLDRLIEFYVIASSQHIGKSVVYNMKQHYNHTVQTENIHIDFNLIYPIQTIFGKTGKKKRQQQGGQIQHNKVQMLDPPLWLMSVHSFISFFCFLVGGLQPNII